MAVFTVVCTDPDALEVKRFVYDTGAVAKAAARRAYALRLDDGSRRYPRVQVFTFSGESVLLLEERYR